MPDADLAFLGLERHGGGRSSFTLPRPLSRIDGRLYGGTGLAAAVAAMELESGRGALWATCQFVASAEIGARIEVTTEVLAAGRSVSQLRVEARAGERLLLCALGATGVPKDGGLSASVGEPPEVADPESSPPFTWRLPVPVPAEPAGFLLACEVRDTVGAPPGRFCVWARLRDRPMTRAGIAFVADMVPMAVARGLGRAGGGTSLDNSIRYGAELDCEWVLVDLEPHLADGGYGHGLARIWSPDGTLLAVASQTAALLLFD